MKTLTSKFRSAIMVPNTKAPCSRRPGNLNQKLMFCHYGSAHVLKLSLFIFSFLQFFIEINMFPLERYGYFEMKGFKTYQFVPL